MPRELRVWGTWMYFEGGQQANAVVATYTKKRAAELLKQSRHTFNQYTSETSNKFDVEEALAKPETVIIREVVR